MIETYQFFVACDPDAEMMYAISYRAVAKTGIVVQGIEWRVGGDAGDGCVDQPVVGGNRGGDEYVRSQGKERASRGQQVHRGAASARNQGSTEMPDWESSVICWQSDLPFAARTTSSRCASCV